MAASDTDFRQGLLRLVEHPDIVNGLRVRDPKLVNFGQGVVYASPATKEFAVKFLIEAMPRTYPADAFFTGALTMQLTDTDRLRTAIERIGKTAPAPSASVFTDEGEVFIPRRADRMRAAERAAETARTPTAAPVIPARPIAGVAAPERRFAQTVSTRSDIRSDVPQFADAGPEAQRTAAQIFANVINKLIERRDSGTEPLTPIELSIAVRVYAAQQRQAGNRMTEEKATAFFSTPSKSGPRWGHLAPLYNILIDKTKQDLRVGRRAARAQTTFAQFPENASIETIAALMRPKKEILAFTFATRQLGMVFELKMIPRENQKKLIEEIADFDETARSKFERQLGYYREDLQAYEDGELDKKPTFPTPPTSILIAEVNDGSRRVVNLTTQMYESPQKWPTERASARLAAILDKVPKIRPLPGAKEASEAYQLRKDLEAAGDRFAGPGGRMYETDALRERLDRDPELAAQYAYRGGKSGIQIRTEMAQRMGLGETANSAEVRLARMGVPVTENEVKSVEQTVRLLLGEEVTEQLVGTRGALPGGSKLKKGETPTGTILVGTDGYAYIGGTSKKYANLDQARTLLRLNGFPEPRIYYAADLLEEELGSDEPQGGVFVSEEEEEVFIPRRADRMRSAAPPPPPAEEAEVVEDEEGEVELPRRRRNPGAAQPLTSRALVYAQRFAADPQARRAVQDPALLVGKGGNASVYALPGEPDLVIRVEDGRWSTPTTDLTPRAEPNPLGDTNVGQALARTGNITILLRQYGFPAGMTRSEPAFKGLDRDEIYVDRIRAAAAMPQSAYDQVARDLLRANAVGLQWDPSKSNNILIDPDHGRFGLVDLSPQQGTYASTAAEVVACLVGNTHAYAAPQTEVPLRPYRKLIIQKMMQAADSTGLPRTFPNDSSFAYSLKLAGLA
jgi:hypothetical protein